MRRLSAIQLSSNSCPRIEGARAPVPIAGDANATRCRLSYVTVYVAFIDYILERCSIRAAHAYGARNPLLTQLF